MVLGSLHLNRPGHPELPKSQLKRPKFPLKRTRLPQEVCAVAAKRARVDIADDALGIVSLFCGNHVDDRRARVRAAAKQQASKILSDHRNLLDINGDLPPELIALTTLHKLPTDGTLASTVLDELQRQADKDVQVVRSRHAQFRSKLFVPQEKCVAVTVLRYEECAHSIIGRMKLRADRGYTEGTVKLYAAIVLHESAEAPASACKWGEMVYRHTEFGQGEWLVGCEPRWDPEINGWANRIFAFMPPLGISSEEQRKYEPATEYGGPTENPTRRSEIWSDIEEIQAVGERVANELPHWIKELGGGRTVVCDQRINQGHLEVHSDWAWY
eukprot:TRINITY_DN4008_c0_g1_i1.p2 TRINITY_DN4008_c0_g1~~TRINITY_DN4008_c0_g1_i1.p2  ORF type:complete len:360 (+),score=113.02 TRINITY_DN4008_c0_g1_i1:99-1082(+)